ncbi:Amidohydrolase [compost metagenome]
MSAIAQHANIYCKVSGMVTEASHTEWRTEDFAAYIQHILAIFGSQRVMFGSDWPVCLLAAEYEDVVHIVMNSLPESWTEEEKNRLFGLNAMAFYKL